MFSFCLAVAKKGTHLSSDFLTILPSFLHFQPMPKIEHNGPGFHYIVKYRPQGKDEDWTEAKISNPMESEVGMVTEGSLFNINIRCSVHTHLKNLHYMFFMRK